MTPGTRPDAVVFDLLDLGMDSETPRDAPGTARVPSTSKAIRRRFAAGRSGHARARSRRVAMLPSRIRSPSAGDRQAGVYTCSMGLSDTVYVSEDVGAALGLRCAQCGQIPPPDSGWQTKSLDPCMSSYVLRHDEAGAVRLYLLDRPSDRRLWRAWTDEEVAESEAQARRGGLAALLVKRRGEGHFLPEAFLPQNRRQRFMGELPHQWVEIYRSCGCGSLIERWIKFSDGFAVDCRAAAPRHTSGFFDEAAEFGL